MHRPFGLETEFGITLDGSDAVDVVAESIELVRRYTDHGAFMKWSYRLEDPHRDARGFRAAELLQDTDESSYFEADAQRPLSFEEIKSDLVLSNGARFYNDHAHPEYSTPECTTLREIVAQEKAGERIVAECVRRRNEHLAAEGSRREVKVFKNNTDFAGHSYGCHDNYLMDRAVPWERVVTDTLPFLVTRQIFAGAGKVGVEAEGAPLQRGLFQLSQRADFFAVVTSIDTMNRRPLVNTRDEPHADPSRFRRFHVIVGDANMSEWAVAMKLGTTALVLSLVESGRAPALDLADPVGAVKAISRDPTRHWIVELRDGRKISAVEIQRRYLGAARAWLAERPDQVTGETSWLLAEWERVLDELARDPMLTRDRVDWAAKKFLLDSFRESEGLAEDDPWLLSLDLEYHNVHPAQGLHHALVRENQMRRFVSEEDVRNAVFFPPETTRAFCRGRAVARFTPFIEAIHWDEIVFAPLPGISTGRLRVSLSHAFGTREVALLNDAVRRARTPADFEAAVRSFLPSP